MKTLYLDCFAGISGDMFIGALLDLGLDPEELERELQKLPVEGYSLQVSKVNKSGLSAVAFEVYLQDDGRQHRADSGFTETALPQSTPGEEFPTLHHDHDHDHGRHLTEILALIAASTLSSGVKATAKSIFHRLGAAEAKVHGVPLDQVHFHEVGGVDAIVDITAAAIGLEKLNIEIVLASPLHLGGGFVRTSHGLLPVPAPATAELLAGAPVYTSETTGELVTPTGAAIIMTVADRFGPLPEMRLSRVGYGAGSREREFPNVLRAYLGEVDTSAPSLWSRAPRTPHPEQHDSPVEPGGYQIGSAIILEANIDDSNPQLYEHLMERLLAAGALDLCLIPVYMKKNRPGILVQILVHPDSVNEMLEIIFLESTTLGVRSFPVTKYMLLREVDLLATPYGPVRVKIARLGERVVNLAPEYEDCRALATRFGVPLKEVYLSALAAAQTRRMS